LNAARGSLRSKILRGLFEPISKFLAANCACKAESLLSYCTGISRSGIWSDSHHKKSIREIIDHPSLVNFDCEIPPNACGGCKTRLAPVGIEKLRKEVKADFNGLCLDCMDRTKPKYGTTDRDYWEHDRIQDWSRGCRFRHGQTTWYFSYMGRREDMLGHQMRMGREN
jgi:hypothetical protein